MLPVKYPLKLTLFQINLISLLLITTVTATLLVIGIGYRETTFGLLAFGGLIVLGLAVAIFAQPQWGTFILIFSIFTNMSSNLTEYGLPGTNKPLIVLVFLGVMANRVLLSRSRTPFLQLKAVEWFMLAFGGAWLASAFVAQDRSEALNQVIDFAKDFVILLCVVYSLEARPTSWKRAVWLIILTAAALAGLGTYQVLTGDTGHTFFGFSKFIQAQIVQNVDDARLVGPIDDPNFYGQALAAVLPLAIYRLLDERRLGLKLVAGLASLLLVFTVINTYSRGAFVAAVLVLILIALERRVNFSLLLLVAVAALAIIPFLPSRFTDRLETLSIFTRDDATLYSEISFRGRASEMLAGVNMFVDHPFLGVGIGNYPLNYQDYAGRLGLEYRSEEREAHSLYLEIAAETGLFGIFTFTGLFASLLVGLTQARKKLNRLGKKFETWNTWITSLQLSVAAYFTSSIFLHGDYIRYLWLLVALGVAMIHLADSLEKKAQANLVLEAHR